jgi:hypothetical protein
VACTTTIVSRARCRYTNVEHILVGEFTLVAQALDSVRGIEVVIKKIRYGYFPNCV